MKMKILFLHAEVMGYTMATINALIECGHEIHVIHWDHKKLTPYQPPTKPNVYMYARSELTVEAMISLADEISPAITVVSGWMDKGYLSVSKGLKAKGVPVVTGFDDQWHETLRQRFAALLGAVGYFSKYFSHAWVCGPYQFEYARRLGFKKEKIIYDLYSADLTLFNKAYGDNSKSKSVKYPRRFLFVGRFELIKGLDVLVDAWKMLGEARNDWELHLIGNGSMKPQLENISGLVLKDFMQPEMLMSEVANAGCFVLPSQGEPWGVVVHEFAAAGLPLIISDVVGAATSFLVPGMNGETFNVNDPESLARKMRLIVEMSDSDLALIGDQSHDLAQRITPKTSAANLLSIVE